MISRVAGSWMDGWCKLAAMAVAFVLLVSGVACQPRQTLWAQEIDIWEYSPYKIGVWMSIDSSLDKSKVTTDAMVKQLEQELQRTFGAAWNTQFMPVPPNMQTLVDRGINDMVIENFTNDDLVLMLDKTSDDLKTLRVFETALEQVDKIGITEIDKQRLLLETESLVGTNAQAKALREKTTEVYADYEALMEAIKEQKIQAAAVPRGQLTAFNAVARPLATTLDWHTERYLRDYEKLFIMQCTYRNEQYHVTVRELDCPMRMFGPTVEAATANWSGFEQLICTQMVKAFAPVARIEEVNNRLVMLLNRAGGLAEPANPVLIQVGEVMQPVIRREEKRGATAMLEPIPWTYIGITKANGIELEGTCYSAMGSVLQGKQSRRAQRVALRVRPLGNHSDVRVTVRGNLKESQPGCQIYQKNLLTDDLTFVGYTDWRGVIRIENGSDLGKLLPERVKIEQADAKRAAQMEADKAAMAAEAAKRAAVKPPEKPAVKAADQPAEDDSRGPSGETKSKEAEIVGGGAGAAVPASAEPVKIEGGLDPQFADRGVQLVQPLVLLYVKSGDTVLARLPLVPGLNELDVADLPSDARRLEAEAHFRGFQGEILDLIAKRAIISSRVSQYLKNRKFKDAEDLVDEADKLPDYKQMSDALNEIHRRMIDDTREPLPQNAKTRIDRMLITSRDMLQKYVELDLGRKLRADIEATKAQPAPPAE